MCSFSFFFHPIYNLRPFLLCPSILEPQSRFGDKLLGIRVHLSPNGSAGQVVAQIRGRIAGSSPPFSLYGSYLAFLSREDSSSSSLSRSTRRVELRLPTLLIGVDPFYFCKSDQNIATVGFELRDQLGPTLLSSIRG